MRAIVFDLDGVLIDSARCHRAAFEEVLLPFGVRDFDYGRYAGWRTPEVIEHVLAGHGQRLTAERIAALATLKSSLARERIAALAADNVCVPVLQALASRYMLGLASSGSRESVERFLASSGCAGFFRSVLSGESVGRAKPDPEIYDKSFRALGIAPADAIVVEDAVSGIRAARAAGAGGVIGVAGTSADEELRAAGAEDVIENIQQLPEWLGRHYGDRRQ